MNEAARSFGPEIVQVSAGYGDSRKHVLVANTDGVLTDDEIVQAYQLLASLEGVFVEPASGASIAGVRKLTQRGYFPADAGPVVCTLTGHGLKDPHNAIKSCPEPLRVPAERPATTTRSESR